MMTPLQLDHITIFAPDLVSGAEHVHTALGVEGLAGGAHPLMGTHNLLLQLGDDIFLEIISIDPAAPEPKRARWFGLDTPPQTTRLGTWAVRTKDIEAACAEAPSTVGPAVELTRGDLNWLITVPDDGALADDGAFPSIIKWPDTTHPASKMTNRDCTLVHFIVEHPNAAAISDYLTPRMKDPRITFITAKNMRLSAEIATPAGARILF